jgi:aquaporin Z
MLKRPQIVATETKERHRVEGGSALRHHWPEYLMEAGGLGVFMVSACVGTVILEHPASPIHQMMPDAFWRRVVLGGAMAVTAVGVIYSPWGQQSDGAHINPAITLTYLRLKKIAPPDAVFYVLAQFLGGLAGVLLVATALDGLLSDPAVNFAATVPGVYGPAAAFGAEAAIAFLMMLMVLTTTNSARVSHLTGVFAGLLVACYVAFEAPISGFGMNPARSFASALPAHSWAFLWIYFVAPVLGMLSASEVWLWVKGVGSVSCAKLNHHTERRRIFYCDYLAQASSTQLSDSDARTHPSARPTLQ